LRSIGLSSFDEYCAVLRSPQSQDEIEELLDLISTNHTRFYREPDHFDYLIAKILPPLIPTLMARHSPLRVWSAASSSGEEPYTLAIVLSEFLRAFPAVDWQICASDISKRVLTAAKQGVYRMDAVEPVPPDLLKRYFQKGFGAQEGKCRVRSELRDKVRYERINLFQHEYPIPLQQHVIFCRNVMIYFDIQSREQAVKRMSHYLAPGGFLIVGHSESLMGINHGLKSIRQGIYQKP
ncbi:MAG: protein-glutamate O-methyltransferase CheR, partial [Proteobacteria bacterium]|nr:protein-glutamate O-methyltransferase CheR [Pseudomonadota bacterium]